MREFSPPLQKNVKKKKQRDQLRVQITRVFALTAEHGCFRQSPMTRTDKGEVSPIFLEFIDGIRYMHCHTVYMLDSLIGIPVHTLNTIICYYPRHAWAATGIVVRPFVCLFVCL